MKRTSFLASLASLIPTSLLFGKKGDEEKKYKKPIEPIAALEEIFQGLAKEYGGKIESNTRSADPYSRTNQTFRLPELYAEKEWWVCLSTQTVSHPRIHDVSEQDSTMVQLCLYTSNQVCHGNMQISLGDNACGDGGFGVRVYVRTCILNSTGEEELLMTNVDMQRRMSGSRTLHPLHRRIIWLFEEMTSGGDV